MRVRICDLLERCGWLIHLEQPSNPFQTNFQLSTRTRRGQGQPKDTQSGRRVDSNYASSVVGTAVVQ